MTSGVHENQAQASDTNKKPPMTDAEALDLWKKAPFYEIAAEADKLKIRKFGADRVSYTLFRIINYTDVCDIECTFCSFMHTQNSGKGYVLDSNEVLQKTKEAYEKGYRQIFFQGGVNPQISFQYYIDTLGLVKSRYPDLHIRGFSPVEILAFSRMTSRSVEDILRDLIKAGLDSFPGAGAEILTARMRNILSVKKTSPEEWYEVMRTALGLGLKASTNIVWGSEETEDEIIEHLSLIRKLQTETGNVLSFVPWTFQQQTTKFITRNVPTHEYLKMVSLSRLYLDNIDHIEVSILVKGKQVGELALRCGADDINSPVYEENVLRSYGLKSEAECVEFITQAGFEAVYRDFNFHYGKTW